MLLDNSTEATNRAQPPKDHVIVRFISPCAGCTLIKESDLLLKDRGLVVGDVVKRNNNDIESGYVTKVSIQCALEPIYTDMPWTRTASWPHKPEDNQITVPAEELEFEDWQTGEYIMYKEWVGEIEDIHEEVTIRLNDGSVVRVAESEDLEVGVYSPQDNEGILYRSDLIKLLKRAQEELYDNKPREKRPAEFFYTGQKVTTKKANLRLGNYVIGSYNPSVPPEGIIVEVRVTEMHVHWLSTNVYSTTPRANNTMPPETLESDVFDDLKLYNRNNVSSSSLKASNDYGARRSADIGAGDFCRFRDIAGAAVKYAEDAPEASKTGVFRRIPRADTLGFDMNAFDVKGTVETVTIQWQSGVTTELLATELIPYLNADEHDIWVGEMCSLKSAEEKQGDLVRLGQIGVVQSVDARERTAKIRWFEGSEVRVFEEHPVMEAGSKLGTLSDVEEEVSVYEVMASPALNKRRGDLVLVAPSEEMQALSHFSALTQAAGEDHPVVLGLANRNNWDATMTTPTGPQPELRWFGEVVDLGRDGLLTVRLGGLDEVEDIRVPVTRVTLVVGGDDDALNGEAQEFIDDMSTDYSDSDYEMMGPYMTNPRVIDEVITYEGGERMDDGGDSDAWTDEGADADSDNMDTAADGPSAESMELANLEDELSREYAESSAARLITPRTELEHHTDYNFSSFPNMPAQFEILPTPPTSHAFEHVSTTLSASLLRRIRKEHGILSSSLPPGIFVRTYEDRLDLLRILIVGPRGTPYELAPFVLDFHMHEGFPNTAPHVHFHSWTYNIGRINPNLYEDGKVCLSILGTWPENEKGEGWSKDGSTILQVLVSLLGLVLVEEPYYNEAGFESLVGTKETVLTSRVYSEKAYCMAKGFVAYALSHEVHALGDVVDWLYIDKQGPQLLKQAVEESKARAAKAGDDDKRLSAGALILLKRHLDSLESRLQELRS
jgi:ubiquitin-conjugating enzyme E2 O